MRRTGVIGLLATAALLLATAAAAFSSGPPTWSGRWVAEPLGLYGKRGFTLEQKGAAVTGRFPWSFRAEHGFGSPPCFTGAGGTLTGTVKGRVLSATLVYPRRGGHAKSVATLKATIARDGNSFAGQGTIRSGECRGVFYAFEAKRPR